MAYNVLVLFHDSDYYSGATRSMLDMILSVKDSIKLTLVFPEIGTASKMAKKYTERVIITKTYHLHMPPNSNVKRSLISHVKCGYKMIYNRLIAIPRLKRIMIEEQIDLIYSNTSVNYMGCYLKHATGKPLIWHLRESGEESGAFRMLGGWSKQAHLIDNYANRIFVISNALKKAYSKYIDPVRLEVIYNDIRITSSVYQRTKNTESTKILIAGRVCEYKNQIVAIRALSILKEKGFDLGLYFAGKCDEKYRTQMDKLSHKYGVYDHIEYLGQVNDIDRYENDSQIMLITTRYEAFGRTAIEGMLHSMIVVCPDSGGVKELVENGHGYIYSWNDERSLATAIESAMEDTAKNKKILKDAYIYATSFTQTKGADRIKQVVIEEIERTRCK